MIAACSPFTEMDVHGKKLRDDKPIALLKSEPMGHLKMKRKGEKGDDGKVDGDVLLTTRVATTSAQAVVSIDACDDLAVCVKKADGDEDGDASKKGKSKKVVMDVDKAEKRRKREEEKAEKKRKEEEAREDKRRKKEELEAKKRAEEQEREEKRRKREEEREKKKAEELEREEKRRKLNEDREKKKEEEEAERLRRQKVREEKEAKRKEEEREREEKRKKQEEAEERQRAQRQKSASIMMQFLRKSPASLEPKIQHSPAGIRGSGSGTLPATGSAGQSPSRDNKAARDEQPGLKAEQEVVQGDGCGESGPGGAREGGERVREKSARASLFLPPPDRVVARDSTGRQARTEEMDAGMNGEREAQELIREFKQCLAAIRSSRPRLPGATAAATTAIATDPAAANHTLAAAASASPPPPPPAAATAAAAAVSPSPITPPPPPSIHHWNQRRCPRALPSIRPLFPAMASTSAAAVGKGNGGDSRRKGRGDAMAAAAGWARHMGAEGGRGGVVDEEVELLWLAGDSVMGGEEEADGQDGVMGDSGEEVTMRDKAEEGGKGVEDGKAKGRRRKLRQLLQFGENTRPAFYGRVGNISSAITGRRPLARDAALDYDVDSDADWEEEEAGETLSCSDGEEREEAEGEEEEEEEEEEGFVVPDGYLSEDEGIDAARKPPTQGPAADGTAAATAAATEASAAGAVAGNTEGAGEEDGTSRQGGVKAVDAEAREKGKAAEGWREGKRARPSEQEDESSPKGEGKAEGSSSSSSRLSVLQRAVQRALASGQPLVLHCLDGRQGGGGVGGRDGASQPERERGSSNLAEGGKREGEEGRAWGGAAGGEGATPAVPGGETAEAAATVTPGAEQATPSLPAATQAATAAAGAGTVTVTAAVTEGKAVACSGAGQDESKQRIDAAAIHRMYLQSMPVRVIQTGASVALPKPVRTAGAPAGANCSAAAAAATTVAAATSGQQKAVKPGVDGKLITASIKPLTKVSTSPTPASLCKQYATVNQKQQSTVRPEATSSSAEPKGTPPSGLTPPKPVRPITSFFS